MPEVSSATQIVREDLSDALIMSDVKNTPVTSRMKKGERLKAMLFSWTVEKLGQRRKGGQPENKDVDAYEGDEQRRIYNRAERWWRTPRVTVVAEKVNDVAGNAQTYTKLLTKKTKDQKRDIETEILSDQDSSEDVGVPQASGHHGGDVTKGLGRVIDDNTLGTSDTATAIPSGFRTPTAQIYRDTLANLTEAAVRDMLQARWALLGATSEFVLYVASALKSHISDNFGRYVPNKSGYTALTVRTAALLSGTKLMIQGVDVYEGDFGTFQIELASYMPTTTRGYGLDFDQLAMRPLMYCDHTELPYQGGGRSGLVDSILGYEFGDPRAYFKIAPSDETATSQSILDGN